jgi:predicted nucleotidyltransferase
MPNRNILTEIVQKIVEEAVPEKIILFGSRAKGEQTNKSDYDICVLKKGVHHKRKLAQRIYLALDVNASVDVIVETPERFNELKNNPFLVYSDIAKYGRVVYEK